jgi:hypothetical protein
VRLNNKLNKSVSYFLLILFLAYYGSITLFNHTHIVNGVTIAHSHPFSSENGETPVKHHHTANEYILIQSISNFLVIVSFLFFTFGLIKNIFRETVNKTINKIFSTPDCICANGLRAPPLNIHN